MKHLLIWILLFTSINLPAQGTFKAGSYKQGTIVKSPDGSLWIAERNIINTSTLPKDNELWAPYVATPIYHQKVGSVNLIQEQINAVPESGRKEIVIPDGKYYLTETITIHHKGIHLIGGADVHLYFPQGIDGIRITRNGSSPKTIIKNLYIYSQGNKAGFKNVGVYASALFKLENVTVKNFGGHGFSFFGNVGGKPSTDCSGSSYYDCEAIEVGGDGVHIEGPDANWISGYNFSARDVGGYGIGDFSFLGCQHYSPMLHYCKKGDYISGDANARSSFFAPYAEGGSPKSEINGTSNVWGGLNENGHKISRYSGIYTGAHAYNIDLGWKVMDRQGEIVNEFYVRPNGKGSITSAYLNGPSSEQLFGRGAELSTWDDVKRVPTFAGRAFHHLMIANRFVTFARSIDDLKKYDYYQKFVFIPGDKVFNNEYNGTNAEGWTCISKGVLGMAKWKAF